MRIHRLKSKGLVLSRMPEAQLRLLQQIPLHADPTGSFPAENRLYQSPVKTPLDDTEDELISDWQDHVLPDLRRDFARQIDCVADDLSRVRREPEPPPAAPTALRESGWDEDEDEDEHEDDHDQEQDPPGAKYTLVIPLDHAEAWYGALNQARLVMQERYHFPEVETLESIVTLLASENIKPYLTSRFYTEIQAALLGLGMEEDAGEDDPPTPY